MRWSLVFLVAVFISLSAYVGWKQGAFAFQKEQMALPEAAVMPQKPGMLAAQVKEPLKSQLLDLIKSRKLDEAAALYQQEGGVAKGLDVYRVLLKLAEAKTKK